MMTVMEQACRAEAENPNATPEERERCRALVERADYLARVYPTNPMMAARIAAKEEGL